MIVTLTPNPSVDRTIAVGTLRHGEVNRATDSQIDPGGKGVNVSRALSANGTPTVAVLPLGGPEGHLMSRLLDEVGVHYQGVPVAGTLRMNVAVVEPDGTTTKVNEPGPTLSARDDEALLAAVEQFAEPDGWVVGCGSLAPGSAPDLLAQLVARSRVCGAKVAVDSSGAPMSAALAAGPDLIKPNLEELEEIVEHELPRLGDVVEAARGLVTSGIGTVVVSLGGDGAVLVNADQVCWASARIENPLSTVGAGDCLLAGLLHVLAGGGTPAEALAAGVRWGAAAVTLPGSRVPGPAELRVPKVSVHDELDLARVLS